MEVQHLMDSWPVAITARPSHAELQKRRLGDTLPRNICKACPFYGPVSAPSGKLLFTLYLDHDAWLCTVANSNSFPWSIFPTLTDCFIWAGSQSYALTEVLSL
jgi:hypothetical protein